MAKVIVAPLLVGEREAGDGSLAPLSSPAPLISQFVAVPVPVAADDSDEEDDGEADQIAAAPAVVPAEPQPRFLPTAMRMRKIGRIVRRGQELEGLAIEDASALEDVSPSRTSVVNSTSTDMPAARRPAEGG